MRNWASKITSLVLCTSAITFSANAAPGLIHKWSGEGDANDSVGTANGTISGGVTFSGGHVGQAFKFDGNGYIDCGTNVAAFGTGDFAIGFWVTGTGFGSLINRASDDVGYEITLNDGGGITGSFFGPNGAVNVSSFSRIDDGNFHHVVVERNSTNFYMFVDGLISGKSISGDIIDMPESVLQTNQIPLSDGMGNPMLDSSGNQIYTNQVVVIAAPALFRMGIDFAGLLDEIEIYPRALTAYEIYSVTHPGVGLAIIDQPFNERGLVGRPILLHLLAVGEDPITYQWQYNGFDIPGAISNNFVLDSPQTFDSGTYTVLVSNPTGDLTSRPATLTITNLATPTNGLIARWSAEGNANDSIGHHDGDPYNIRYVPGVVGTAFQFNGRSVIGCPSVTGDLGAHDFTIDFWMQTTVNARAGEEGEMCVLGQTGYGGWNNLMDFNLSSTGSTFTYLQADLGDYRDQVNPPFNLSFPQSAFTSIHLTDGVFHHIAGVRSSNVFSLFIDGMFVAASASREPCVLQKSYFMMGDSNSRGSLFKGCLDEVEVFDRALSDSEIFNTYSPNPTLAIVRQPRTKSVVENQPVSMTVSAAGTDPISYQWRLNGNDIPDATTSTYALASAQLSDAGIYSVFVSNPITNKVTAPAQLTVIPANSILPGLLNRWSAEGDCEDSMGKAVLGGAQCRFSPGVSGQAWKFDGGIDEVGVDYNTGQFGYNDFTWSFWVRYEKGGTLIASMPAYRFSVTNGKIKVQFGEGARDFSKWTNWFIMDQTNAGSWFTNAPVPITDGQFHHVAIARTNTTNVLIYIDGKLSLKTVMPRFNLSDQWGLGFCDDYGRFPRFAGDMDEVELYNRSLTSDEVLGLYNKYASYPRSGYSFREISATIGSSLTLNGPALQCIGCGESFQWTLNGVPILGATGQTYTIASVDVSTPGLYAVIVTTPKGTITSPIARVSNQLPPGSFNGLFYLDNDITDDSAGFITLTLNIHQTYSGQILQKGKKYPITGKFAGTNALIKLPRSGRTPLVIQLSSVTTNKINGVVNDATRRIPLEAHRAVYANNNPTPQAGTYTIQMTGLSSPNAPNGHGFGNLTIATNGQMTFIANLADDTTVSANALVANSGVWPLYASGYNGHGSVMGWMSFTNNRGNVVAGTLRWIKAPRAPLSKIYTNGFATRIPAIGSTFIPSASGLGINLTNCSVVFDAAKIYNPLNDPIVSTDLNNITFADSNGATNSLLITPGTGRFSGSFTNPVSRVTSRIKGIVMQDQSYAVGYFIRSNLSGRIVLQHN